MSEANVGTAEGDAMTDMGQLVEYAKAGTLHLYLDPAQFDKLLTACDNYIDDLKDLQWRANDLSHHKLGFAEDKLESGKALAEKFQKKGVDAADMFQSHIDRVEEMKSLFQTCRNQIHGTDLHGAKNFNNAGR